ncbi:MAG: hypothetical protein WCQ95_12915 [Bacteroidota bacterium]
MLLHCLKVHAQDFSNFRIKTITVASDTLKLDSLSIIPKTLLITLPNGQSLDTSVYRMDYANARMIIVNHDAFVNQLNGKSLQISYRVFPFLFTANRMHKNTQLINTQQQAIENPFLYKYEVATEDVFKWGTLNKSGNISRGVSFGNNQDVVVNSSLNLQLSGYLSDEIQVLAAITDNNIPIQPDGNTQQLQEFDKVFIQLFNKNNKIIAGDFEVSRPNSYFMNFYKKAQGALIESNIRIPSKKKKENALKIYLEGCGAVAKGRYARNVLVPIEGNQGPYKLTGVNNENYIIVLSGTERVYIDGVLLTRGQDNDYIIDYNLGEVSFTPQNVITKDKRVVVEFEYTDRYYARTLFFAGTEISYKKLNVRFNYFSEQDLKNQPLQQDLTDADKLLLQSVGDSTQLALIPNVDSIAFSTTYVMYKMIDTTVASVVYDSVFVYSTHADSAFYRLGFSFMGAGKGNYVLIQSSANGRVFKWVAPISGKPSGDYEPVTLLIAPKKTTMYTLAVDYGIGKTTKITIETALTDFNRNTFSSFNKEDDRGYAVKAAVTNIIPFAKKSKADWKFVADATNEWVSSNFNPIEQYRPLEFSRDWNLANMAKSDENMSIMKLGVQNKKNQFATYKFKYFIHGSRYKGMQNQLDLATDWKNFFLTFNGAYLQTNTPTYNTVYFKQKALLVKKFKWFNIGANEEQEHNVFKPAVADSLIGSSFAFTIYEAFVASPDSAKNRYKVSYKKRYDYLPFGNKLLLATDADDFNLNVELTKTPRNILKISATYRMLKIIDTLLSNINPDNLLIGRIEYYTHFAKNVFQSTTFYEVGSGMEEKKEYSYIEVAAGQGVYSWTDYNNDGIKQLNEFDIAAFKDQANYLRVFTPTHNYIKTYSNQFTEALTIDPGIAWNRKTGFRKFVSRFMLQSSYSVGHKSTNTHLLQAYNPFYFYLNDTSLMTSTTQFKSVLFFNKSNPKIGVEISYQINNSKQLLINGFESRSNESYGTKIRWNITRKFYMNLLFTKGIKTYSSEYFTSKNFDISFWEIEPKFIYQPGTKFRMSFSYNYSDKLNTSNDPNDHALNHNLGLEIKYNFPGKGTMQAKVNYINIQYNSSENTSLAYEMLSGFKPGQNITWNFTFQRNLANNLQLDILYDGRKTATNKIVHVGTVQIRAYF